MSESIPYPPPNPNDMGHPEPFNLKYIGIGNEQWDTLYPERLEPFIKAIRKAYPAIKIVGSAGPNSEGDQFDYLWPEMRRLGADLVDEHFYRPYDWFLSQGTRYDNYDLMLTKDKILTSNLTSARFLTLIYERRLKRGREKPDTF